MIYPCHIGFRCPYKFYGEDGDSICIHPYRPEDIPDDEEFGLIDEIDCLLIEYPSPLYDLLKFYDAFSRGSCPSQDCEDV